MRRILMLLLILCTSLLVFAFMYRYMKAKKTTTSREEAVVPLAPSPTQTVKQEKTVSFNNEQFAYSYFTVRNPADLSLLPNFTQPKDAQTLMTENNCISGVNGGFYDKSNKPLGYFQTGEKILGPRIASALVNGFVWADASGSAVISNQLPNLTFRFALQTGPMLLFNGKVLPLTINNDTHARRMVAARTMDKQLVFFAIYTGDSIFEGTLLADLPDIVQAISTKENLNLADAINLDGGSASAFYSGNTKLSELTPVGSLFCLQNQ